MSDSKIALRRAELRDSNAVLSWRNDEDAVRQSLSGRAVSPARHLSWFREAITSPDTFLFVAELVSESEGTPLGMCRFEHQGEDKFAASINIAPEFRGRGWGQKVLASGIHFLDIADVQCHEINAIVHQGNPGSRRIFEKVGFTVVEQDDSWLHLRLLL
mgnify:CR=1 FL=1